MKYSVLIIGLLLCLIGGILIGRTTTEVIKYQIEITSEDGEILLEVLDEIVSTHVAEVKL